MEKESPVLQTSSGSEYVKPPNTTYLSPSPAPRRQYDYANRSTEGKSGLWVFKAIVVAIFCFIGYVLIRKHWDSSVLPFLDGLKNSEGLLNESKSE